MSDEQITNDDKLFAALSYIFWPLALIVLVLEPNKNRPFQRYHGIQALGFAVVVGVPLMFMSCVLSIIGLDCLTFPLFLVVLALAIWFAYQAYQGEKFEIPVLTEFMKQQEWLT
jgi:uncharacterized membrane protein